MLYARIFLLEHGSYILPLDQLHNFIDEVKCAAANGEKSKWTIQLLDLTEKEYKLLPEFEGY